MSSTRLDPAARVPEPAFPRRAWRWLAARPALAAALVYAFLSVVFAGQGLLPGRTMSSSDLLWSTAPWRAGAPDGVRWGGANFELADTVAVFQPFFEHARGVLPDAPLWNAQVMGGRPFLANGQSAILSPFSWPAYVLPFWKSFAVMAILKLFVAAFGTYLFARALGMRFGGALLAGIVFAFGTFFVVWLGWPLTNIFPLIPWVLLLTELLVRRPGRLEGAGLAAAVGLVFLGGHPETTFHVLFATGIYFVVRVLVEWRRAGRERRALTRPVVAFGLALLGGVAISAVTLLPLLEFFVHSGDYARRLDHPPSHAVAKNLGALFLFDYWGRPTQTSLVGDIVSNRGFYAGGITLMLAAIALIVRPTGARVAFAAFGLLALLVVLGADPLFSVITALPGFRTAHNGRMVIFVLFTLAMLAGWGLDDLSRSDRPSPGRTRLAIAAAAAIFIVPFAWMLVAGTIEPSRLGSALKVAWGLADPPPPPAGVPSDANALAPVAEAVPHATAAIVRLSALLQWLVLAGAALVLIVLRLARRPRWNVPAAAFVGLALLVLAADLFRANMGFNPAIPVAHAEQPKTGAIRYLESRRPNRFAGLNRVGIGQPLQPDLAMRYGLYDARGYDYPVIREYDDLWRATAAPPGDFVPPTSRAEPTERSLRGMSLLSVADLLQDPADPPLDLPGTRLAYSGPDARVYRNVNALPRAFLVGGQRVVEGDDDALAATIDPGFDPRAAAVTERKLPGVPTSGGGAAGTARVVEYEDERVVVDARARRPGLLVLTDVHYPGWKAVVDGRDVPIERVDYLLRGVPLPAGAHTVEFRYEPVSWRIGWIISVLALLTVAGIAIQRLVRAEDLTAVMGRLLSWWRRRPALAAAVIYLLVVLAFVGPALLPGKTLSNADVLWFEPPWVGVKPAELTRPSNPELGDEPRYVEPFLRETARRFPSLPLWNPNIVAGRPYLANSQSAFFGPFTWPVYLFDFWTALTLIGVLKLWVAAFGMFLLGRALGMRFAGALLAGIVFALNLKMVTWLTYPHMGVWALMPWLMVLADRLVKQPGLLTGAGLAALVGLQFLAGHAESSFHVLLAVVAFFALRLWQAHRSGAAQTRPLRKPLLTFAGSIVAGTALAAAALVPFAELLGLSADLQDRRGFSIDKHLPAQDILGIFLPDYWGRPTQTPIRPLLLERAMYVGALPLMLAGAALILRATVTRVAVAAFGAFWFAVVIGVPPFTQIVTRIPPFSSGHNTRLIVLTLLSVALLAGWGLDELARAAQVSKRRRWLTVGLASLLVVAPAALVVLGRRSTFSAVGDAFQAAWLFAESPVSFSNPARVAVIRLSSLFVWEAMACLALLLIVLRFRRRLAPVAFVALALALVCVDLFRAGMGYNPAIDRDHATLPATGAIKVLERHRGSRFVSTSEIPQNVIPMDFDLYEARGYDLPIVKRFDRFWRRQVSPESPSVAEELLDIPLELRNVTPEALRALRLLGVTYVLHATTGRAADPPYKPLPPYEPLDSPGLTQVYSGPDARVYRLDGALPRAWVVGAQRVVDGADAALAAVRRPDFEPRRVAITERRVPGVPEGTGAPAGRARITRYEPEHAVLRVDASRPGLVVLSDTDFPGWQATLDGREVSIERVDYLLRGVRVGPGTHTIEFRYRPRSWTVGWIVSVIALAGLVVAVAVGLYRRRRAGARALVPAR